MHYRLIQMQMKMHRWVKFICVCVWNREKFIAGPHKETGVQAPWKLKLNFSYQVVLPYTLSQLLMQILSPASCSPLPLECPLTSLGFCHPYRVHLYPRGKFQHLWGKGHCQVLWLDHDGFSSSLKARASSFQSTQNGPSTIYTFSRVSG